MSEPSRWARSIWEALQDPPTNEAAWEILDLERSRILRIIRDVAEKSHECPRMTACDACDEIIRRLGE